MRRTETNEESRRLHAYQRYPNDTDAANSLQLYDPHTGALRTMSVATFRAWRISRGLPRKEDARRLTAREIRRRHETLRSVRSVRKAARQLGISVQALRAFSWTHGSESGRPARRISRRLPTNERAIRETWYRSGLDDREVARRAGITVAGAIQWRRRYVPDVKRVKKVSTEEHARRLEAYRKSFTDAEAAQILGIARGAFTAWRVAHGLEGRDKRLWKFEEGRRIAAYQATQGDKEAGRRLGLSPATFARWRRARGLDTKHTVHLPGDEERRRILAYLISNKDATAAAQLGIQTAAFTAWRLHRGLPPGFSGRSPPHELPALLKELRRRGPHSSPEEQFEFIRLWARRRLRTEPQRSA